MKSLKLFKITLVMLNALSTPVSTRDTAGELRKVVKSANIRVSLISHQAVH